jgi:hypothetical protein
MAIALYSKKKKRLMRHNVIYYIITLAGANTGEAFMDKGGIVTRRGKKNPTVAGFAERVSSVGCHRIDTLGFKPADSPERRA